MKILYSKNICNIPSTSSYTITVSVCCVFVSYCFCFVYCWQTIDPHHKKSAVGIIYSSIQRLYVNSHRILLLINISNARRAFYILKGCSSGVSGWKRTRRTCAGGFFELYIWSPAASELQEAEQPSLCVEAQLR